MLASLANKLAHGSCHNDQKKSHVAHATPKVWPTRPPSLSSYPLFLSPFRVPCLSTAQHYHTAKSSSTHPAGSTKWSNGHTLKSKSILWILHFDKKTNVILINRLHVLEVWTSGRILESCWPSEVAFSSPQNVLRFPTFSFPAAAISIVFTEIDQGPLLKHPKKELDMTTSALELAFDKQVWKQVVKYR